MNGYIDRQAKRANKIITEYQKRASPIIGEIAKMIDRGDSPEDIQTYYDVWGWDFPEDIWLIARYMIVLDEAQQN